jgi:hypothetical protein
MIDDSENSQRGSALGTFYVDNRVLLEKFHVGITP